MSTFASRSAPSRRIPAALVVGAGLVIGMAMGARHVQGLFMLPLLADHGWGRGAFSLALGLQMLVWGLAQPLAGLLADQHGSARVVAAGCVLYALALVAEALAPTASLLAIGVGVVGGIALTATTFTVVYGALSRLVAPERRGTAQGIAGAVGGFVQFLLVPLAQGGIDAIGWARTLLAMALATGACALAGVVLRDRREPPRSAGGSTAAAVPASTVVRAAMSHSGFWLLNLGFVSCGFQLAFLGAHLPAYLRDAGMPASAGVRAIAIIALANAIGTYFCGRLGDLYRRKYLLAIVYAIRTAAMIAFVMLPLSTASLYAFATVMGATWLGTVPLTNGVVAQIFGVRYIGTLFGLVFLGHQLGGFFGAWLGGVVYDATHSYQWVWAIAIALGLASIVLNLPIRDRPIEERWGLAPAA